VLLFAAAVYVLVALSNSQTVRLAGGTELSLVAVTQGPTNVFVPGGLWDQLIRRWIPAKGITVANRRIRPSDPLTADGYDRKGKIACPNKAVFWVSHRGATTNTALPVAESPTAESKWFNDVRAEIVDEHGERWEMRPGQGRFHPIGANGLIGVSAWEFPSFPRRGRNLKFRIYGRDDANGWDLLAEFNTPNPVPGSYPTWKASPLPVTQRKGDLEVSLVGIVSGAKAIHYMEKDQRPFTTTSFEVKQHGQPTEAWLPDRMEAADATGNEGSFQIVDYGATNGVVFYDAQGSSLSPNEVWRLRMRFTHEKDLLGDQTWTSTALAVREGTSLPMTIVTNFQNYKIVLRCDGNIVDLKLSPAPTNAQLRLIDIVDDQGRSVQRLGGNLDNDGFLSHLKMSPEIESVRVTISLCESLDFEFLAQPMAL
jgi:hypothetical protein